MSVSSNFALSYPLENKTHNTTIGWEIREVKTLNVLFSCITHIKCIAQLAMRKPLVCNILVCLGRLLLNQYMSDWLSNFLFFCDLPKMKASTWVTIFFFIDFSF